MDEQIKRQVLRKLPYGMYIMTASTGSDVAASTLTWLSQCSFRPPLVMLAVQARSRIHEVIDSVKSLAVNILGESQKDIAETFFRPVAAEAGRLGGWAYTAGPATGAPILADVPAWFEARVTDSIRGGDHTVFVAEVIHAGLREPSALPLRLAGTPWNYGG
jgi:flavin reductase (DIM6/NTAB) family NADH-FMN oxidoreductase RutF